MINRYNDHAANERTYLAWLRTSLALVAFGFVLERFDLFLQTFAKTFNGNKLPALTPVGREAGMILVALGLLTMVDIGKQSVSWLAGSTSTLIERKAFPEMISVNGVGSSWIWG